MDPDPLTGLVREARRARPRPGPSSGPGSLPVQGWLGSAAYDPRSIAVMFADRRWSQLLGRPQAIVRQAARAAMAAVAAPRLSRITVLLANDQTLARLNARFRGKRGPTNVLSFPPAAEAEIPGHLGDLAIAFETWLIEARSEGKSPRAHLAHLVVHGTLHLLGHDHETEREAARMERLETMILARLGHPDPYRPDLRGPDLSGSDLDHSTPP